MSEKKAADATTLAVIRDWAKGLFYQKPSGGIPKTDLASAVQASLGKADSAIQDISGKADKPTTTTVTIATSDWSSLSCTKSVSGMTASKIVLVSPAPSSFTAYTDAGVRCSAQGSGTLTFSCDTVPSSSVTVNILILG